MRRTGGDAGRSDGSDGSCVWCGGGRNDGSGVWGSGNDRCAVAEDVARSSEGGSRSDASSDDGVVADSRSNASGWVDAPDRSVLDAGPVAGGARSTRAARATGGTARRAGRAARSARGTAGNIVGGAQDGNADWWRRSPVW